MSRPPRPHHQDELTYGTLLVDHGRLQMLPWSWEELIELQRQLARDELGMVPPGGEGDFTETLFELSALVAHVLGKYQDHYGSEAYLGTAGTTRSLLRHGRRLAYTTDPGLSATGTIAITVPLDLVGELPAGLALSSAPQGQRKAQKYETLAARKVDARWNAIEPSQARVVREYEGKSLTLVGTGHGLEIGDHVVLAKSGEPSKTQLHELDAVIEDVDSGTTTVQFINPLSETITTPTDWILYAHPREQQPLFGHDADPVVFPANEIASKGDYPNPPSPFEANTPAQYGYRPNGLGPADIFTAKRLDATLVEQWLLVWTQADYELARVVGQGDVEISFYAWQVIQHTTKVGQNEYTLLDSLERWISASTTALQLERPDGTPFVRAELAPGALLRHGFKLALQLVLEQPNPALHQAGTLLSLAGQHAFEPGMRVFLTTRSADNTQLVQLERVVQLDSGTTEIQYASVSPSVGSWQLGDLLVLGNVVPVSHGSSRSELLGDSDGITAHQRFVLRKSRVTQLPGPEGAEPALVLRVGEVTWTRVADFGRSGPTDRHYRIEIDAAQQLHLIFGDGRRGAIPPKGRRHIVADYRGGLGPEGNLEPGALTRLAQAHPLVDALHNPLALAGGTEPAEGDTVGHQATRWIRTFDRAVSTRDHADLALLYPGVARTNVTRTVAGGVSLIVADAKGLPIADRGPLREFMQARRDTSVPLQIIDPQSVPFHIAVQLEIDPAFNVQALEQAVRTTLYGEADAPGLFTFAARELGQSAHLSEVHALLQAIPGVVFVHVNAFHMVGSESLDAVHDVLRVHPHQWLSLAPAQLDLVTSFSTEEIA